LPRPADRRTSNSAGTAPQSEKYSVSLHRKEERMNQIVYIVGLIVIVVAILSFFGLR